MPPKQITLLLNPYSHYSSRIKIIKNKNMRQDIIQRRERSNEQRKGFFGTVGFHILLALLALLPLWNLTKTDSGGGGEAEGIMALGALDAGGVPVELAPPAAEQAAITPPPPPPPPVAEPTKSTVLQTDDKTQEAVDKKKDDKKKDDKKPEVKPDVKPTVTPPITTPKSTTTTPQKPTIDPQKAIDEKRKADAKVAADAKAQKAAADAQALKDKLNKNLKGNGAGSTPGKQGSPTGSPTGTGTGKQGTGPGAGGDGGGKGGGSGKGTGGMVGGGLGRALKANAAPLTESQERGSVVIDICIDRNGNVVSATKGQAINITSSTVIGACIVAAKKYQFAGDPNAAERECGNVKFNFKLE